MTTLYPGQRVWIGWTDSVEPQVGHVRLSKGTIYDGPIPPGDTYLLPNGGIYLNFSNRTEWIVNSDNHPNPINAAEHLLTPIDDDGESEETEDESLDEAGKRNERSPALSGS